MTREEAIEAMVTAWVCAPIDDGALIPWAEHDRRAMSAALDAALPWVEGLASRAFDAGVHECRRYILTGQFNEGEAVARVMEGKR